MKMQFRARDHLSSCRLSGEFSFRLIICDNDD